MGIAPLERNGVKALFVMMICVWAGVALGNGNDATNATDRATVIVTIGAAGEEEFGKEFERWAELWGKASEKAGAKPLVVGLAAQKAATALSFLKQALASEPTNAPAELRLVLIGHGTFAGNEANFTLRGADFSATEWTEWLKPFRRPLVVINTASSSSPFLNKLSAPNRIIVTATRSGSEENFARFGKFMAESIADSAADLDKDQQTSLLEAFIMASRRTSEFYEADGRLVTEHALLDDNGDALGTPADFFRGVRAVKKPAGGGTVDGLRAHQVHLVRSAEEQQLSPKLRERRDELELAIARLRETRNNFEADEYYRRLEKLMLELAELYSSSSKSP